MAHSVNTLVQDKEVDRKCSKSASSRVSPNVVNQDMKANATSNDDVTVEKAVKDIEETRKVCGGYF